MAEPGRRSTAGAAGAGAGDRAVAGPGRRRIRARIEGTVQGVGFRPYVYRLVGELGLDGFVLNDERGVLLEAEGQPEAVERLLARLPAEAPPLAAIERVLHREVAPSGETGFEIVASASAGEPSAAVSPDTTTCGDCLAELFDPTDRRYRYPFINCTNCGPRFTIVRGVPYDRPLTTMAAFAMCGPCRAEYEDPADRRFHAQPNACPDCGPVARLVDGAGRPAGRGDAIRDAAGALAAGRILAVKGLGGYHLACRADDEAAVAALRSRKHREDKPFAIMAPDLEGARELAAIGPDEERRLVDRRRPIVLVRRRPDATVARSVAPASPDLGVMLPYSPLHHLLLADAGTTLVMTSGNVSDEPIAYRDDDALRRLGSIADLFLVHDRPIHMRTDDSVVRTVALGPRTAPLVLRRSRGHVPESLGLPVPLARPLVACGAELKSTFCVAKADRAWVGHHVGDLKNFETLTSFREGIEHFERLFAVEPELAVHDLHPDYLSTAYALERKGVETLAVQHHHAHLAAALGEHGQSDPAIGAIYDGAGYGTDGTVWGGELLAGDAGGFRRVGHLWPARLPGGDQAVREPWRMACAWLVAAGDDDPVPPPWWAFDVAPEAWRAVARMAREGFAAPVTTSVGRLFDAVAALCGIRARIRYEGQAAIELEAASEPSEPEGYPMPVVPGSEGRLVLDARVTIRAVVDDLSAGAPAAIVGARFHAGLADATARIAAELARREGLGSVVLSGGVFQNRRLLEATAARLDGAGLRVLVPERLPPNDGGIAYGQAVVAASRLAAAGGGG